MAGLLPLETSFAERKLHLGYRRVRQLGDGPWPGGTRFQAHEFHYASTLRAEGPGLFDVTDSTGAELGTQGLRHGSVAGSFLHLIDRAGDVEMAGSRGKKTADDDDLLAKIGLDGALGDVEKTVDRWLDGAADFLSGRDKR
jgi:hypothetical protein